MLANELDEAYLKRHNNQELLYLGHLQSLRVFAICIHMLYWEGDDWDGDNLPDIWTAFPWLLRVLKTVQK